MKYKRKNLLESGLPLFVAGLGLSIMASVMPSHAQTLSPVTADALSNADSSADPTVATTPTAADLNPTTNTTPSNLNPTTPPLADQQDDAFINRPVGRENMRENSVDGLRPARYSDEPSGIRLGTFVFRPTISEGIGTETTKSGNATSSRVFSQTTATGQLISDWSRHELRLNGSGTWQSNISGSGATAPTANLDANLRLDISRDTIANFNGAYSFTRESSTDPNSITGASVQAGVHTFKSGADLTHDFGAIRGTIGGALTRVIYSPATLSNGSKLYLGDRNNTTAELRLRAGYEVSPVLMPFVEVSGGKTYYDQTTDSSGYRRSSMLYAAKAGLAFDFGEKLRGELAGGYAHAKYDDARLAEISALTIDGNVLWSPQRGTDVTLGAATSIRPSTVAGESGAASYALNAAISRQMLDNLVARLSGSSTFTHYNSRSTLSDQTEWAAAAGLSWSVNRYMDITGDLGMNYTDVRTGNDTTTWKAIAGVKFKR